MVSSQEPSNTTRKQHEGATALLLLLLAEAAQTPTIAVAPQLGPPARAASAALTEAAVNHAAKILHEKVHPHRDYGGPLYETYDAPKTWHSPCKCPDGQTNPFLHIVGGVATDYDHAAPGVLSPLSTAGAPLRRLFLQP